MSIQTHENKNVQEHGGYERRDMSAMGIIYFLVGLAATTLIINLLLAGMYSWLDKRERAQQAPVSPLVTNVPTDTRQIPAKYPEKAFPDPRLETDERNQLNEVRLTEEQRLNSYGWVDEKAGTVHIPIERAMDLVVQRGIPVRSQETTKPSSAAQTGKMKGNKQ
jgi:hypothetical protein